MIACFRQNHYADNLYVGYIGEYKFYKIELEKRPFLKGKIIEVNENKERRFNFQKENETFIFTANTEGITDKKTMDRLLDVLNIADKYYDAF